MSVFIKRADGSTVEMSTEDWWDLLRMLNYTIACATLRNAEQVKTTAQRLTEKLYLN